MCIFFVCLALLLMHGCLIGALNWFEFKIYSIVFIMYLDKPSTVDLPRSSSTSSLDNIISNESVCDIQFSESFTYKNGLYY